MVSTTVTGDNLPGHLVVHRSRPPPRRTTEEGRMDTSRSAAEALDAADPLAGFRARFAGTEDDGPDRLIYLDGNSLGRMPRETPAALTRVVEQEWAAGLVGWWSAWIGHATLLANALAAGVLGARPGEVLV